MTNAYRAPGNQPPAYPVEVFRTTGSRHGELDVWMTADGRTVKLATEWLTQRGDLMVTVH